MKPQSPEDYQRHLQEAVDALHLSSAAYDNGFMGEAKRLAATIRVLVHDTKASKSLLGQMDLKQHIKYSTTPGADDPLENARYGLSENLVPSCHLTSVEVGGGSVTYRPLLDDFPPVFEWQEVSFDTWWSEIVVCDNQPRRFSRRDLVLALANKDGGAHIDPQLDDMYASLSRENSIGWEWVTDTQRIPPSDGPHLASVRQISHELEKSIRKHASVAATNAQ